MLGKNVRVRVARPIGTKHPKFGFTYERNFGFVEGVRSPNGLPQGAYILGVDHPVREFEGRVAAVLKRENRRGVAWVVVPKSRRLIESEIRDALEFAEKYCGYSLDCFYELSCGAVVYRGDADNFEFLLIKNKGSAHWGFPKGHVEPGETLEQTAKREVWEETGLNIELLPDFQEKSEYVIQGRIEKTVIIYLASADSDTLKLQEEEISDGAWLPYEEALKALRFDNDKTILRRANEFLKVRCGNRSF